MRRREFLGLAGAAVLFPRAALGQQGKVPRVAVLSTPQPAGYDAGFRQGLADYGYVIGKSLTLDYFTAPTLAELPMFAAMAVASRPDVIATPGTPAALAAKSATVTIPIVFISVGDPVAAGLVQSYAKTGPNITGNTLLAPDLVSKQIQILTEVVPNLRRLAILDVTDDPAAAGIVSQVHQVATMLRIEAVDAQLLSTVVLAAQFTAVVAAGAQAVYVPPSTYLAGNGTNRQVLTDLLLQAMLPAVSAGITPGVDPVTIGLIGYGPNTADLFRRAATLVDAILKGAKPSDLPVQQPSTFEFVINLKAAKAMGLTVPSTLLLQATQVIE